MKNGDREPIIDAKGRKRGMKQWVVCPLCDTGRWLRDDDIKRREYTGFCAKCHNKINAKQKEQHPSWKGGRRLRVGRYVLVYLKDDDPYIGMTRKGGEVEEHRIIMARYLGRCLESWEIVHHINGVKDDNRLENLELLPSKSAHMPLNILQTMVNKLKKRVDTMEKRIVILEAENHILKLQLGVDNNYQGKML